MSLAYDLDEMARGMIRYQHRPVAFVREVIGAQPDPWQIEAFNKIRKRKRLSIRAGHGVGKTAFESWLILWFMFTRPYPKVVCTAPTKRQLIDILWSELAKWLGQSEVLSQYFEWTKTRLTMVQAPERWWAAAVTASKPENFAGIHEDNVLMVFDEASGIKDSIYETAEGAMTTAGSMMLLCGNPTQNSGEFYHSHHKLRDKYATMKVASFDSPRVDKSYIETIKRKYGEDSNIYRVRVAGEFPEVEDGVLIPLPLVESALMRDVCDFDEKTGEPLLEGQPISIGVDVAYMGGDETVIYYRVGGYVFPPLVFHKQDTTDTAAQVVKLGRELMERWNRPDVSVNIDMGAMGPGVYDQVNRTVQSSKFPGKWRVTGVYFGGASPDDKYDDDASWMWGNTLELLADEEIHLPDDERTVAQLTTRKYRVTPKGKIRSESKDDYKKRHPEEGSPDRADALVLCLRPIPKVSEAIQQVRTTRVIGAGAIARKKF